MEYRLDRNEALIQEIRADQYNTELVKYMDSVSQSSMDFFREQLKKEKAIKSRDTSDGESKKIRATQKASSKR